MPVLGRTNGNDPMFDPKRARECLQLRKVVVFVVTGDDERQVRNILPGTDESI